MHERGTLGAIRGVRCPMFKNCRSNKLGVYQPGTKVPVPHKVRLSIRQFVNYGRVVNCRREWGSGAYDAVLGDFTAAPRPREDVGLFFQLPKRMRVLDIALRLQCHPNRLVSTMRTMYPDSTLFQDVTSVCTLPQNTLVPLPAGLDLGAFGFWLFRILGMEFANVQTVAGQPASMGCDPMHQVEAEGMPASLRVAIIGSVAPSGSCINEHCFQLQRMSLNYAELYTRQQGGTIVDEHELI